MKHHVVAGAALLGMAGCAQDRTAERAGPGYATAVGLPPEVPPIGQTINVGMPPLDRAAVLASAGAGATRGPAQGRAMSAQAAPPAAPVAGPSTPAGAPEPGAETPVAVAEERPAAVPPALESRTAPVAASVEDPPPVPPAIPAGSERAEQPSVAETSPSPPAGTPAAGSVSTAAAAADSAAPVAATPAAAAPAASTAVATSPTPATAAAPDGAPAVGPGPTTIPLEVTPGPAAPAPAAERTPVRQSIPLVATPGGDVSDAVSRLTAPPAQPPANTHDPLLGNDPDVMPRIEVPSVAPAAGAAPAAGMAPAVSQPPAGATSAVGGEATEAAPRIEPPSAVPAPVAEPEQPAPAPALAPVEAPPPPGEPAGVPSAAAAGRDPLLGANPPLMPDMESLAAKASKVAAPAIPSAPPAAEAPAPSSAGQAAVDALPPVVLPPPAEAPPAQQGAAPPVVVPPAAAPPPITPVPSAAREEAKHDPALVRTAGAAGTVESGTVLRSELKAPRIEEVSRIAARVGDDVITVTELSAAMMERRKRFRGKMSRSDAQLLAAYTLDDLVERSLVLQEAKRKVKDPKKYQAVLDAADKAFQEYEVPALMRKYRAEDEKALKEKLLADDSSYERARENFRYQFIMRGFMEQKLSSKLKVDLPAKRAYYNEHLNEFNRPARTTWREVVIEVKKSPDRAAAHRRAEAILARLRRGDDFAKVAEAESDGPTKKGGGRWQTMPGGYGVASVNHALESLPIGQVSPIIEGPTSYHILLVEERREAGPARFDEVQDEVQEAVYRQNSDKVTSDFLDTLRRNAFVWTMFDGTAYDRANLHRNAAKPKAGSN